MSVSIKYKGEEIASASIDTTKTIKTSGKYCEGDIEVINTQDGGITPSGKKLITDTSETDVAAFATAQVSSDTLLAENIKKDVNILGVVGSFDGGGGDEIYYDGYLATPYTPNMVNNGSPQAVSLTSDCFRNASHLESAELLFDNTHVLGARYIYNTPIKRIVVPNMNSFTETRCFGLNSRLQYVELGSIGHPVTSIRNDVFYNTQQSNLTILVYVDAQAISEIASGVISTAPWDAVNATIVYKNSTTGEVLT